MFGQLGQDTVTGHHSHPESLLIVVVSGQLSASKSATHFCFTSAPPASVDFGVIVLGLVICGGFWRQGLSGFSGDILDLTSTDAAAAGYRVSQETVTRLPVLFN